MTPSQLGPFRKLVLRARIVHIPFQRENLCFQSLLLTSLDRRRRGKFDVEKP